MKHKSWPRLLAQVVLLAVALAVLTTISPPIEARTLYWGSRGADVRTVQWKLQSWGYYRGPIDGIYGAQTYRAVRYFQAKNGLRVDGIVGPQTRAALGLPTGTVSAAPTRGVSNNTDVYLLARTVNGEALAEPYEGKVAVAAVLLNRVKSSKFPNTLAGVVYQPLAFESVGKPLFNAQPSAESLKAARAAINGWDPTYGCLYFWNPSKPVNPWVWSRQIVRRIGNHIFAK
ncbi:MAG: spore cortex-lytic enzyme [Bacillota bacterium]